MCLGKNEMTFVLLLCSIFLVPILSQVQQKEAPPTKTRTAPRDPSRQDAPRQHACHKLSEAERQELEKDLQKMRTLIGQMQHNLAATATGQTPLKRQFELDIEMWQLLVQRMERRLEASAKNRKIQ
jgi:septal ring factor EnvC (AmiA/AmiB activator)